MADETTLLNQLFDEASSFKFEEQVVKVDISVPRNLSEQEINAVTMVTKFDESDFIQGVNGDLRPSGTRTPWVFFWVNKNWYNSEGNSLELGKLFPGALVASFTVRSDRMPMAIVTSTSIDKLKDLAEVHYLVMPIKTMRTRSNRGRGTKCEYLGAGFYTHGNYSMNDHVKLRDVILFGKPAALANRNQPPSIGSYGGFIQPRLMHRYIDALLGVKEFVNQQYDAAV